MNLFIKHWHYRDQLSQNLNKNDNSAYRDSGLHPGSNYQQQ